MSKPSAEIDQSWPEVLPSDGVIRGVFDRVYGYETIGSIDDPYYRVKIVHDTLIGNYEALTTGLHKTLTKQFDDNNPDLNGRQTSKAESPDDPLILFHGLDREKDIEAKVLPAVQGMFDDLMTSGMGPQDVLDHMAAITGVVIAQSQSFSDGNTRIARAMHDFIRDGREGVRTERVFDYTRNFVVPAEIEDMILAQNVTRMINGRYEDGEFYPTQSSHIPDSVRGRLVRSNEFLKNVLAIGREYSPIEGASAELIEGMRLGRLYHVENRIANIVIPDYEVAPAVVRALRQKEYGPAAWTVAFRNRELVSLPLGRADAQRLLEADQALLRMRIVSLAKGMQSTGVFYWMTNAESTVEYQAARMSWMPSAIHR